MAITAPPAALGKKAPEFFLTAADGGSYHLSDVAGPKGTVVVFICNHCPYVKATVGRMVAEAKILMGEGIGFVAISSNDVAQYPEDSYDNMILFAEDHHFTFPYLHDPTQEVARAYDAACTPDFFGLNAAGEIQYRGRFDEGRTSPPPPGAKRELLEAMRLIARTGRGPAEQIPSIGCGIKWKDRG